MNLSRIVAMLALILASTVMANAAELGGKTWRLVKIMSMDDNIDVRDESFKYTIEFGDDGRASIRADCNRASGPWSSQSDSQLKFGPIASTRALCPPGSLSDKYLAQLEWVRSYVMKDGHLFLATMADGSIIEFEPASNDQVSATYTVLGEELRSTDGAKMQEAILSRLFDRYASDKGIKVEQSEIDTFVANMRRDMAKEGLKTEGDLKPEEVEQVASNRRNMAQALIRQWKINQALYEEFGGRIIYQQFGPEPLDAYRQFLEKRQSEGAFAIHDQSLATSFWRYFTDESMHDFMEPGSTDEAIAFAVPPWERNK